MTVRLPVLGGGGFLGFHPVAEGLAAGHGVTVFSRSGRAPLPGGTSSPAIARETSPACADGSGRRSSTPLPTRSPAPRPFGRRRVAVLGVRRGVRLRVGDERLRAIRAERARRVGAGSPCGRRAGRRCAPGRSLAKLTGEQAVTELFDGPALFPRVGIMVGPRSRRFPYWPMRIAGAVEGWLPRVVPVPGDPDRDVQYSDARDIAAWTISMLTDGRGGTFNTVGPGRPESLRTVLLACLEAAGGSAEDVDFVVAKDEDELRGLLGDVGEEDRPLWYPEDQIPQSAIDSSAAIAAGLRFRPALATAAETLAWARETEEANSWTASPPQRRRSDARQRLLPGSPDEPIRGTDSQLGPRLRSTGPPCSSGVARQVR